MTSAKTILVHAGADAAAADRIRLAAGLAQRFGALLIGLAAGEALPPLMADPMGGDAALIADLLEEERRRLARELADAERAFRDALLPYPSVPLEWRGFLDRPADALAREARAADLLVIGREPAPAGRTPPLWADPGDVLMQAARPVLVVPPGLAALAARGILLAWRDTREARRAAADALPVLAMAEHVLVLEVVETAAELDPARRHVADVAAWLGRHGVARVAARADLLAEPSVADALLLAAEAEGADLIVAGGYGHARLREWVFGGVTRGLLRHVPKCCLLSH